MKKNNAGQEPIVTIDRENLTKPKIKNVDKVRRPSCPPPVCEWTKAKPGTVCKRLNASHHGFGLGVQGHLPGKRTWHPHDGNCVVRNS